MGLGADYTARRCPVHLVYSEACASVAEARRRERQLKGWTPAKKEALIVVEPDADGNLLVVVTVYEVSE